MVDIVLPDNVLERDEFAQMLLEDRRYSAMPDYGPSSKVIAYLDMRSLSRESMGRWLANRLREFRVITVADCDVALQLQQEYRELSLVLVNLGATPIKDPEIRTRLRSLSNSLPDIPIAVISDTDDHDAVMMALGLGLRGFIPLTISGSVMLEVVRLICAGGTYAPANSVVAMLGSSMPRASQEPEHERAVMRLEGFTPRQMEILNCLRRGLANKLIAHELHMQESTVKVHVRNIMKKLRATNRTQVVSMTWELLDGAHN